MVPKNKACRWLKGSNREKNVDLKMNILSLFLLPIIFLLTYYFLKKFHLLNDEIKYSNHKKFGKNNISPVILGGIYFIIVILFFFTNELLILKISLLFILFLGLLSDKNILPSPKIRIIFQFLILFFLVYYSDLKIQNLENDYLNFILSYDQINLFFTIFCLAILLNGSNFIDGLNGLLSGYFLLLLLSIFFVSFRYEGIIFVYQDEVKIIFLSLLIFFIFNIIGKVYLGDGGSYLLAAFIGYYLIEYFYLNPHVHISPYYIASILWYPAFENLFSISRRVLRKNEVSEPDNKHLHQLIFLFIKSKEIFEDKKINSASSIIILFLNLPSFVLSSLLATHSQILLFIILMNIILYILIYNFISKNLKINK